MFAAAAGAAVAAAVGGVYLRHTRAPLPPLELRELRSVALDPGFDLAGAVVAPDGRVLAWSGSGGRLLPGWKRSWAKSGRS